MNQRRGGLRRTPSEWALRGALALGATILGYNAVAQTFAYTQRKATPELAYRLAPGDGRIVALLAEQSLGPGSDAADQARADRLARRALLRDPTAVSAAATLGLGSELRGARVDARRAFAYAERLSRRDLRTQIWAIEDSVARGDVPDALEHYDIALRTSRIAPDLLFPILATAMADPAIRTELVRTLSRQPLWTQAFIEYAAANATANDPVAMAAVFAGLSRTGVSVSGNASAVLINALIGRRALDQAWAYYASIRPGTDRRRARDARFTAGLDYPSPFDWIPVSDGAVSSSIQRGETGGVFDFAAPPGVGGLLLRQMQLLPAGAYVIEGHSTNIEQPTPTRPYWALSCLDGRELGRVAIDSTQAAGRFAGRFVVPPQCAVQYLSFNAGASDQVAGTSGQIDRVVLRPAM